MRRPVVSLALLLALHVLGVLLMLHSLETVWRARRVLELGLGSGFFVLLGSLLVGLAVGAWIGLLRLKDLLQGQAAPRGATWRGIVYIVVFSWLFHILVLQPYRPLFLGIHVGFVALLIALLDLLRRRVVDRPGVAGFVGRGWRLLDRLALLASILVIGGELGLRGVARVAPSMLLDTGQTDARTRIDNSRYPPGTLRRGFPCNQRGYYDEEFVPRRGGERIVAAIGDSFSAGVVPHHFHFTTVAERQLDSTRVHNIGLPFLGPAEYRWILVNEVLPMRPDVVVVNLFVGNDVIGLRPQHRPWDRVWLDRKNVLLHVVPSRLGAALRESMVLADRDGNRTGEVTDLEELRRDYPWLNDPLLEEPTFSAARYRKMERDRAGQVCGPSRQNYAALFDCLEQLRADAGDVPLLFLLIPDEFQVEDATWAGVTEDSGSVELDRDRPQRMISTWLEQHGIEYLDLLPVLRAIEPLPDGNRHLYHLRDSHFNARGNQLVGEALARFLKEHLK